MAPCGGKYSKYMYWNPRHSQLDARMPTYYTNKLRYSGTEIMRKKAVVREDLRPTKH